MSRIGSLLLLGTIGWIIAAGLLAVQFWPAVPHTSRGWIMFVVGGPPLWFLFEAASEWIGSTRGRRAVSNHPSTALRIFAGVMLGVVVLAAWLGLSCLLKIVA
jgi:hypothetical protein